jgi:hypothetical protein
MFCGFVLASGCRTRDDFDPEISLKSHQSQSNKRRVFRQSDCSASSADNSEESMSSSNDDLVASCCPVGCNTPANRNATVSSVYIMLSQYASVRGIRSLALHASQANMSFF